MKASNDYVLKIGDSADPSLVGGKGASLSRMIGLGLDVPPGITITTRAWRDWSTGKLSVSDLYREHVDPLLKSVFPKLGINQFVSVRSGAPVSMPGMMETVLWVGTNSESESKYIQYLMSYARAIGLDESVLESISDQQMLRNNTFVLNKGYYTSEFIKELENYVGIDSPDVDQQITSAIQVVFDSWNSDKAKEYRSIKNIPNDLGTACTIQLMINAEYGLSGVMLTRGEIEWLRSMQGDAVVDGRYVTRKRENMIGTSTYKKLVDIGSILEKEYHDAMDVEFTHDDKTLYVLQCRPAKRTPIEAMRIAIELYEDGIVDADYVLNTPIVDDSTTVDTVPEDAELLATGSPINGKLLHGFLRLGARKRIYKNDIVLRSITTTDDIAMMSKALATITMSGGTTCHAALVARDIGSVAVVGVGGSISRRVGEDGEHHSCWTTGNYSNIHRAFNGEKITILPDGRVYRGWVTPKTQTIEGEWSAKLKRLKLKLAMKLSKKSKGETD